MSAAEDLRLRVAAARAFAILGAGLLALSFGMTPALAEPEGAIETLDVSGVLMVVPDEPMRGQVDGELGGGGTWLATDEGPLIPLDEQVLEELVAEEEMVSGARLEGAVELPPPVAEAVGQVVADTRAEQQVEASAAEVLEAASVAAEAAEAPLPVVEATVAPPVEAATLGVGHQADVLFISKPGQRGVPSDAEIRTLLSRVSTYWAGESNGLVPSIATSGVKRAQLPSADICSSSKAWTLGADAFGRTLSSYYAPGSTRHLVTLALDPKCVAGVGTVGVRLGGGASWVNLDDYTPQKGAVVGAQTLAHELGHNFGLAHANARACTGSAVDASTSISGYATAPCTDIEYGDLWNVMGVGIVGYTSIPAALATSQRDFLDAMPTGSLRAVDQEGGLSQTFTLGALSSGSGLRGLYVTPREGAPFYVEYRNGLGQDSGVPQASGAPIVLTWGGQKLKVATGVRVIKPLARSSGLGSTVLGRPASGQYSQTLRAGESLLPHGETAQVTVVSTTSTTATVRIDFGDPLLPATPAIAGPAKVGATLSADPGSWSPEPDRLAYQWLRDGTGISGATAASYKLTSTDAGKKIAVKVTGTKGALQKAATSSATAAVGKALTARTPALSGTATVGSTLKAVPGAWGPTGVTLSYQWLRDGAAIPGATKSTYKLASADRDTGVSVRVTGKKSGYYTESRASAAKTVLALPFADVAWNHPFFTEISWMKSAGVSTGAGGKYLPGNSVTREQMAAFIYRMSGSPAFAPPPASPFGDVAASSEFYAAIAWLYDEGITTGQGSEENLRFNPKGQVTREQMAAFIYRMSGSPAFAPPPVSPFGDVAASSEFYAAIAWLYDEGITTGQGTGANLSYVPKSPVTRGQMAAFLYRYAH